MSKKLSAIATNAVDVNSSIVGVQDVAGIFSDKRYTIAALIAYLKSFFVNVPETVPTITLSAGGGTGGTYTLVRGNDNTFTLAIHVGASAAANTTIADISYGATKPSVPNVVWCPSDQNSIDIVGTNQSIYIFSVSADICRIRSGNSGLTNGVTYIWTIISI